MVSDLMNDVVQLRMHHRLAAGNRDDGRTERSQLVYAPLNKLNRNGRRRVVILITVTTSQITTTHRNQVGKHRMMRRGQRPADKAELPDFLLNEFRFSHCRRLETYR